MKTLLFAGVAAMLAAAPAMACRGTAEYPQAVAQLARADLPTAEKEGYARKLEEGAALHRRGHDLDDAALRRESLAILDAIKAKLTQ